MHMLDRRILLRAGAAAAGAAALAPTIPAVTHDPQDTYVFKVPSLRNVAMTPPISMTARCARS
jgi:cytochrome c peroxidase